MAPDRLPARGSSHGLIDNFYLSKEELLNGSPTRRAGVDVATETQLRIFGCTRVQLAVLYLELPQAVAATGQVLLHRFYCKQSMTDFDVKRVAIAATWLASKLEEAPKKFADVLSVFVRLDCRAENRPIELLDPHSQRFENLKKSVFDTEKSMLRNFGFVTHVEHPHKFVLSLLQILEVPKLLQEAWNLTNDSLRTTLCVRFKSEVVACGIIFLAARRQQVPMPESAESSWWELCGVTKADVFEVAAEIHSLYSVPAADYVALSRPLGLVQRQQPSAAASLLSMQSPVSATALHNGDISSRQQPASALGDREAEASGDDSKGPAVSGAEVTDASGSQQCPRSRSGSASGERRSPRRDSDRRSDRRSEDGLRRERPRGDSDDRRARSDERHRGGSRSAERSDRRERERDSSRHRERSSSHVDDVRAPRISRNSRDARTSNGHRADRGYRDSARGRERDSDRGRSSASGAREPDARAAISASARDGSGEEPRKRDAGHSDADRKRERPLPSDLGRAAKRSRESPPLERPGSAKLPAPSCTPSPLPPPPVSRTQAGERRSDGAKRRADGGSRKSAGSRPEISHRRLEGSDRRPEGADSRPPADNVKASLHHHAKIEWRAKPVGVVSDAEKAAAATGAKDRSRLAAPLPQKRSLDKSSLDQALKAGLDKAARGGSSGSGAATAAVRDTVGDRPAVADRGGSGKSTDSSKHPAPERPSSRGPVERSSSHGGQPEARDHSAASGSGAAPGKSRLSIAGAAPFAAPHSPSRANGASSSGASPS